MLTVKEVAELLGVSPTCVYQLVSQKRLSCHRVGVGRGTIRITNSDLAAFLENCRREHSSAPEPVRHRRTLRERLCHLRTEPKG